MLVVKNIFEKMYIYIHVITRVSHSFPNKKRNEKLLNIYFNR